MLLNTLCADPETFLKRISGSAPVVLDWGFPPEYLGIVRRLKTLAVRTWWLGGDWDRARIEFEGREIAKARAGQQPIPIECFDIQRAKVEKVWKEIRRVLNPNIIEVLPARGRKLSYRAIVDKIMAE